MPLIDVKKPATALWILVLSGFILYANTFKHDFNLDDTYYTAGNQLTTSGWSSIPGLFTIPTIYGPKGMGYDYRPVTAVSFVVQHQLLGQGAPAGHFINVILYILTIILIYNLLLQWLNNKNKTHLAFWIALLFLVHPLHTEVVTSIKSRDELLALLFSLLSLKCWTRYLTKQKSFFILAALLFLVLALFSKYTVLPFIFYIPLALYFFYDLNWPKTFIVFGLLLVTALACHLLKNSILPDFDHHFSITENGLVAKQYGMENRIATSFYIMGRYLLLHLFPLKLVYYYGYNYVPVVGWSNVFSWLSLIIHLSLLAWCFYKRHARSLLLFGLLLYLGHIIIYSNLVELAPGMIAERFVYVASLGFCMALVMVSHIYLEPILVKYRLPRLQLFFFFIILLMSGRTITRNSNWKNKESLYAHDVKEAPQSAMLNYLYGDWLLASSLEEKKKAIAFRQLTPNIDQQIKNRIRQSQIFFKQALLVNPLDTLAQYNLASSYIQLDDFKTAENILSSTVNRFPQYAEARFTLGLSQVYQQKYAEAIASFEKLLKIDSTFIIGYEQLNRSQLAIGDTSAALATLHKAMSIHPQSPVPLAEMANYYLQVKDTTTAIQFAEKAAALPPANQGLLLFLRDHFHNKGNLQKAGYYFNLYQNTNAPLY